MMTTCLSSDILALWCLALTPDWNTLLPGSLFPRQSSPDWTETRLSRMMSAVGSLGEDCHSPTLAVFVLTWFCLNLLGRHHLSFHKTEVLGDLVSFGDFLACLYGEGPVKENRFVQSRTFHVIFIETGRSMSLWYFSSLPIKDWRVLLDTLF